MKPPAQRPKDAAAPAGENHAPAPPSAGASCPGQANRPATLWPKSIRARLLLWLAFLLMALLSGFGLTAYRLHRVTRLDQIDHELETRLAALGNDVRGPLPFGPPPGRPPPGLKFDPAQPDAAFGPPPPEPSRSAPAGLPKRRPGREGFFPPGSPEDFLAKREIRLSPRTQSLFDEADTNGFYFAVWSRGGDVLLRASTNAPPDLVKPARPDPATLLHVRIQDRRREVYQFTELGECILVGRSIAADLRASRRFAGWLALAGLAVLAVGLGGGWILTSRALRPVRDISATATRIAAGNLAERINVAETDSELGRLAAVLNSTFARLEAAFAQQKQFTADAAHELRTPLAVLISEAQTTLARERTAAEYRETLEACLDTAQQMRRLTQSLLDLARLDAGQECQSRATVDLAQRAAACIKRLTPMANQHGVQIQGNLAQTQVRGDPDRLDQVLLNLLANAIQYNRPGGEVRVTVHAEGNEAVLTVADTGQGIAAEDLPHVFERFYRADKARRAGNDHCGLGLAICRAIVEAHGGSISIASQPDRGTTVTVRLPR